MLLGEPEGIESMFEFQSVHCKLMVDIYVPYSTSLKKITFIIYFVFVGKCVGICLPWCVCVCVNQRTTCRSWVLSFTV